MNIVGDVPSARLDQRADDRLITSHPVDLDPPPPQRTCGRCRRLFAGDPTLHRTAIAEWWACDDCRASMGLAPNPSELSC